MGGLSFLFDFNSFLTLSKKDLIGIEILLRGVFVFMIEVFLAALLIQSVIIFWLA